MQGKSFLIFGLISVAILIGVVVSALFRTTTPSRVSEQTQETTLSQSPESLLESEGNMRQQEAQVIKQYETAPAMQLNENVSYTAVVKTSKGDITIELFADESPNTVNNFVFLAREGFYNGTIFHRVIADFMIQGGDPLGNGTGGPGYKFADEFNDVKLVRGSLAMANAGPNTNGSQFFIVTTEETPWLDGAHTNFGRVLEGMEVVGAVEAVQVGPADRPLEYDVIDSIEIIETPSN